MKSYYIYIVLTRTNTTMSRAIQVLKNDEYTHASITLDPELHSMYSFGRKYTSNPLIGHFKKEELCTGLFGRQKTLPCLAFEIEVTASQYHKVRSNLQKFIDHKELYKYNYMGLIHSFQKKSQHYEHRFLCSEFVYHILKESDVIDLKIPRNLVRPEHLKQVGWPVYFEGDLRDMHPFEGSQELSNGLIHSLNRRISMISQALLS